jgi:hypothetical protein
LQPRTSLVSNLHPSSTSFIANHPRGNRRSSNLECVSLALPLSPPLVANGRRIEGSTIIIAACIPVLQPLVQIIFYGKTFDSFGTYPRSRSTPKNPTSQGGVGPSTGVSDTYPLSPRSPAPLLNHTSREDLRNNSEDDMDLHSFLGLPPGASKDMPRPLKEATSSFDNVSLSGTTK